MDSFYEQHHSRLQLQLLAVEFSESCHEIIFRHLDSFPCKQLQDIALKIVMVYRIEIVKVKLSVRKTRSVKTVHEIVICRE